MAGFRGTAARSGFCFVGYGADMRPAKAPTGTHTHQNLLTTAHSMDGNSSLSKKSTATSCSTTSSMSLCAETHRQHNPVTQKWQQEWAPATATSQHM